MMRRSFAIASTANRFVHRSLLEKGNPGTASPSFPFAVCCWERAFSALSALAVLGKMMKLGYEPSIVTLSRFSMVSVTGIGSQMQSLCLIKWWNWDINLIRHIQHSNPWTFSPQQSLKREVRLMALKLLKKMEEEKIEADVVIYNTVIDGLCKYSIRMMLSTLLMRWRTKERFKGGSNALFRKMKEDGPLPNSGVYNTLIRARLRDGDKAASAELINEMKSCGFAADASTFGLVLFPCFERFQWRICLCRWNKARYHSIKAKTTRFKMELTDSEKLHISSVSKKHVAHTSWKQLSEVEKQVKL
ncbi:unnamed protein product [Microthlaspi erraticum]|uniref:Pentacotripeptide-repeat region of PRORP domain-containing protein n=1 Tax=Microthlaspi erraticum TaxID=1685480 RepID=A0A6D2JA34_9BRAS|nr:unnamed protein product [Microthlaspi erraticum]